MSTNKTMTKAQRREAARAEALALKQKQEAADRRARLITLGVLGAVVALLVGVVIFLFVRDHRANAAYQVEDIPLSEVQSVPAAARPDGGIPIGTDRVAGGPVAEGKPEVAVYLDYLCPACGAFETANLEAMEGFIADGTANLILHPISILDRFAQGTAFSTRAASAAAFLADRAPEAFLDFHILMFENEPEEGTPGHDDEQIAEFARQAGAPDDVVRAIADGEPRRVFGQWVHSATREAAANAALRNPDGNFGTPTITIDGERWGGDWMDPANLPAVVADATS